MNEIYDSNSARLLLGALLINPQIINDDKYPLNANDFSPSIFHKRLFQAISNLAKHGAKSIECIDVYRIAEKNTSVKELCIENIIGCDINNGAIEVTRKRSDNAQTEKR